MMRFHALQIGGAMLLAAGLFGAVACAADSAGDHVPVQPDPEILKLVEQLGSPRFETRERAQAELARHGLQAFDVLFDAQFHKDVEIALRARYLLRSIPVEWSRDDDPQDVKIILRDYGRQKPSERSNRMDKLAALDGDVGAVALCRLVRFEHVNQLSKRAALAIMNRPAPEEQAERTELSHLLETRIGASSRPAAGWVRAYAQTLRDPSSTVDRWSQIVQQEEEELADFPEKTSPQLVRDLLRWHAVQLRDLNEDEKRADVLRRMIALLDGGEQELLDTVNWLLDQRSWSMVEHMVAKFPEQFEENPTLQYRLAEAQRGAGRTEESEATAAKALKISGDDPKKHTVVAFDLQDRGLFAWSEREYRVVLNEQPINNEHNLRARSLLAELLHDQLDELNAARVLQVMIDAMDDDPNVMNAVRNLGRDPGAIRSRMHFFYAEHYRAAGEKDKVFDHLDQAVKADPTDADALIAMYRVPNPTDEWKERTKRQIDAAAGHFLDQVNAYRRQIERFPDTEMKQQIGDYLASACNQYAWLVGNTEGDYQQAIRLSHLSLEHQPNTPGYLDTLGRCYYAVEDYENAIKYQRMAVKLEPHAGQIGRQLQLFEKAMKEQQKEQAADKPDSP